jgi:hypothetical protein
MCPMQDTTGMLRDSKRWPKHYQAYLRAITKMLKIHELEDKKDYKLMTPKQYMDWWIYNPEKLDKDVADSCFLRFEDQ